MFWHFRNCGAHRLLQLPRHVVFYATALGFSSQAVPGLDAIAYTYSILMLKVLCATVKYDVF